MQGVPAADPDDPLRVRLHLPSARLGTLPAILTPERLRTGICSASALVLVVLLVVMAIGKQPSFPTPPRPAEAAVGQEYAVAGPLAGPLHQPDLLIVSEGRAGVPRDLVARQPGVRWVEPVSLGSLVMMGRSVAAAAVEPSTFRALTSRRTAELDAVWDAVARGELAVTHDMAEGLQLPLGGETAVGSQDVAVPMRVGAIATTVPAIDLVVNRPRGAQLGLAADNALIVSVAGDSGPAREKVAALLGNKFTVTDLTPSSDGGVYAARLVGGSVADAVGSFNYRWFADGTVAPDPAWVSASIVTASVPILGAVTCHRVLIPQLRGAMQEIVDSGLEDAIDRADYGGCYVPRFIGRDPSRGLSLHTWGIALDLNVATNQLGTVGEIDRRIVAIMARWGFGWGGSWRVPDPMHFELAALTG